MSSEELIREAYYNMSTGFISADKLYRRRKDKGATKKEIKEFLKT